MSRFIKISSTGEQLPHEAAEWVAVLDTETDLMWPRTELSKRTTFAKAPKLAAELDLAGFTDWRMPTRKELLTLVDDSRFDPAIDTDFFQTKGGWCWTSTPFASSPSDYAWLVYFYYGGSYYHLQDGEGLVRPVRSARARQ